MAGVAVQAENEGQRSLRIVPGRQYQQSGTVAAYGVDCQALLSELLGGFLVCGFSVLANEHNCDDHDCSERDDVGRQR